MAEGSASVNERRLKGSGEKKRDVENSRSSSQTLYCSTGNQPRHGLGCSAERTSQHEYHDSWIVDSFPSKLYARAGRVSSKRVDLDDGREKVDAMRGKKARTISESFPQRGVRAEAQSIYATPTQELSRWKRAVRKRRGLIESPSKLTSLIRCPLAQR